MKWSIKASAFLAAVVVISTASYAQLNQALMLSIGGARLDGVCGSANGASTAAAPTANLCSAGIASSVTGSGPWNWTCNGANGGTSASCSAPLTGSGGAVPQPAQDAGFTMPALSQDFANNSADQNINSWLDCKGAGSPKWFKGWVGFTNDITCDAFQIAQDPVKLNQALRMHWENGYLGVNPSSGTLSSANPNNSYGNGALYTNYYVEVVSRQDNDELQASSAWWGKLCNFGPAGLGPGSCVMETDFKEQYGTGVDSATHNFTGNGPGGCPPNGDCALSVMNQTFNNTTSDYHKFAVRQTAQLGGAQAICAYYQDVPDVGPMQLLACSNQPISNNDNFSGRTVAQSNGDGAAGAIALTVGASPSWTGCSPVSPSSSGGQDCSLNSNGGNLNVYIKSIKIYVCPAWTANQNPAGGANQCFTSSPNP